MQDVQTCHINAAGPSAPRRGPTVKVQNGSMKTFATPYGGAAMFGGATMRSISTPHGAPPPSATTPQYAQHAMAVKMAAHLALKAERQRATFLGAGPTESHARARTCVCKRACRSPLPRISLSTSSRAL